MQKVCAVLRMRKRFASIPLQGMNASLDKLALSATTHCLTGCAIGEVAGMAIGTAAGWSNLATTVTAIVLAFFFGYALTVRPLLAGAWRSRGQLGWRSPASSPGRSTAG